MNIGEWIAFAVTVLRHLTNLGTIEYFGEDEPWVEFISAGFLHHLQTGSWRAAVELLVSGWHPPVRFLASALGVLIFGANEVGTRLLHTASGFFTFFALRRVMAPLGARARTMTLLLYAAAAPAVLHRMNGGHGLFISTVLWAFVWIESAVERRDGRWMVAAALLLALAFFNSYEGILFYPYLVWRLWQGRRAWRPAAVISTLAVLAAPLIGIGLIYLIRGWDVHGMGLGQLTMRVTSVHTEPHAWNVGQKLELFTSAMTPIYLALVAALTFEAFNRIGDFTKKAAIQWYGPENIPACPSSERWGKRALAARLDPHFGPDETLVTNFGSGFQISYLHRPVRGDYHAVMEAARAGQRPSDPTVTAMLFNSFGPDFAQVKAAFPFARTFIPALEPEAPDFLIVWLAAPGDRLVSLADAPAYRLAAVEGR